MSERRSPVSERQFVGEQQVPLDERALDPDGSPLQAVAGLLPAHLPRTDQNLGGQWMPPVMGQWSVDGPEQS